MQKRFIALIILAALLLPVLAACGETAFITPEKAQKITLKAMGYRASQVDQIHAHGGTYQGEACYSIHVVVDGVTHEYIIRATDGQIMTSAIIESEQ